MADVNPTEPQSEHVERAGAKLRQDQEEVGEIVDLIPQTIVVLNLLGKAIYANSGTLEYLGLSLEEIRADDFRVFH